MQRLVQSNDLASLKHEIIKIMNAQYSQVTLLGMVCTAVNTSKIILFTFLVSFFMNRGILQSTLMICQAFHTSILHIASADLQDCLKHVWNFLIIAAGAEMNPEDTLKLPVSHLAIKMEPITLNQTIHLWAEHQMNKIGQAALAYDTRKVLPNNVQTSHMTQQDHQRMGGNVLFMDSQAAGLMTNSGTQQHNVNNSVFLITMQFLKTLKKAFKRTLQQCTWNVLLEKKELPMSKTQMWDTRTCILTQITIQFFNLEMGTAQCLIGIINKVSML